MNVAEIQARYYRLARKMAMLIGPGIPELELVNRIGNPPKKEWEVRRPSQTEFDPFPHDVCV